MCMYIPPWFAGLNQLDGIGRIGPPDPDASWYHKNGSNEELSTWFRRCAVMQSSVLSENERG
eukprot:1812951-Rhodomonas_salina.4